MYLHHDGSRETGNSCLSAQHGLREADVCLGVDVKPVPLKGIAACNLCMRQRTIIIIQKATKMAPMPFPFRVASPN